MTIRAVVFDLGGTYLTHVYQSVHRAAAAYYGVPLSRASRVVEENLPPLFRAEIDEQTYWRRVGKILGSTKAPRIFWTGFYPTKVRVKPKMHQLATRLRHAGYTIAALTNTIASHHTYNMKNGRLAIFDAIFASSELGLAKPDPAIYQYASKHLHLKPEEIVYIDDQSINVRAARSVGMHGIVSWTPAQTRQQLRNLLRREKSKPF